MDPLSDILSELRVESAISARFDLGRTGGVAYGDLPGGRAGAVPAWRAEAGFHVVVEGELELVMADGRRRRLAMGDFVLFPRGGAHALLAGPGAVAQPVASAMRRLAEGTVWVGNGATVARYVCGAFRFGAAADHPLLTALPDVVVVAGIGHDEPTPWLYMQLDALICESTSRRPGAAVMIARLAEALFIQALRRQLLDLPPGAGAWLGALRDPALARALGAMHREPARPWTVATLAREAGMSRSHFAERFSIVVGEPPLTYLARWRMHRGRALLSEGTLRVGEVARRVGYGSEAAFSTAFRRVTGMAPGAWRRAGVAAARA